MCATQDNGVDFIILFEQVVDVLFYKIIGSGFIKFIVFHQWDPYGTGFTRHFQVGMQFGNFDIVRLGIYGA
jgi:hypothetical protein